MYTVSDLMTREVLTLKESDDLSIADTFLRLGRIRHLPVTDENGRLLGLVTHRDLVRCHVVRESSPAGPRWRGT
jgi:CBS domain-containing protein